MVEERVDRGLILRVYRTLDQKGSQVQRLAQRTLKNGNIILDRHRLRLLSEKELQLVCFYEVHDHHHQITRLLPQHHAAVSHVAGLAPSHRDTKSRQVLLSQSLKNPVLVAMRTSRGKLRIWSFVSPRIRNDCCSSLSNKRERKKIASLPPMRKRKMLLVRRLTSL